ncbi:MAG: penicillin acylase family protein, partial [Actinomycetota bacterium]
MVASRVKRALLTLAAVAAVLGGMLPVAAGGGREITIVRDRFGVPNIYAATAEDVSYGAGYALAQDRLWQMHVFSLVSHGRLSHLFGSLVVDGDKELRFWTYTAEERARRFATYPADIQAEVLAFVEGVNAWIAEVRADPAHKLPLEYAEYAEPLEDWTLDDSIAMADYLIYTFGSGGGAEIRNLALLQELTAKFGATEGQAAFNDLVWTNDPDAPLSIPSDFNWHENQSHARAEADAKTLESDARISLPDNQKIAGPALGVRPLRGLRDAIKTPVSPAVLKQLDALQKGRDQLGKLFVKFGSNAQIVGPKNSETGNALGSAGPQVGLFVPQALSDFGLHSEDGKLDAVGMTFAGAGPAVLIGRGHGFEWTTTTGASDITDTFVEQLNPANPHQYLFNPTPANPATARWENMECRTEAYEQKGAPFDSQEICRTRHGPILAFDTANNIAYSVRYAWFNREGGTMEGFFNVNSTRSIEDFATSVNLLASNHNMFYADDQGNIGYWHPGNFPVRPAGDLRLPFVGTGGQEWLGLMKAQEVPHAVHIEGSTDPNDFQREWLANWNNKPAADWDRENGWGAVHGVQALLDNLDPNHAPMQDPWGGTINGDRKVSWQDLNANLRYAAFRDFNADFFQPFLPSAGTDAVGTAALDVCGNYNGFIYDDNGDGYVDSACYTVLGRYVGDLRNAVFADDIPSQLGAVNSSTTWHAINPAARLAPEFDWLNDESAGAVRARAFATTVAALREQFGNDDPRTWKSEQPTQHYTRTNTGLAPDIALGMAGVKGGQVGYPGDTPDQIRMNRGTYNHLVAYLDPPSGSGILGESRAESGSVIAPGQSDFISLTGEES